MKILIVDDNKENLYLLDAMLKGSGYDAVSAVNGKEALEKLRSEGFNMIISDILMPVMDGFTLCRECKRDENLKDIPFIFYTATYKDKRDEELALKLGADRYLLKPMEPEKLIDVIQGLFRDIGETKVAHMKPVLETDEEIFKLYNERLIKKLEKKMLALESETTQRKLSEKQLKHLNRVLRAIRDINQLIVREDDRQRLIQSTCGNLTKIAGYYNTWIALFNESGELSATAETDLGEDFTSIIQKLKNGDSITCVRQALKQADVVVIKDPLSSCSDCPLAKQYSGRSEIAIRFEHDSKVYGLLVASVPVESGEDKDEQSLLMEIAGDIAFALATMENEKQKKQVEGSLLESEDRYRDIVEHSSELICTHNLQGQILSMNAAGHGLLGYTLNDILAMNLRQILVPEVRGLFDTYLADIQKNGMANGLMRVQNSTGETLLLEYESTLRIEGVTAPVVRVISRNITERRRIERAMKESEEKYRTLFEDSMDAVYITKRDGEFVDANQAMSILVGYDREEMIGMNALNIYVDPDDRKKFQQEIEQKGSVRDYEIKFRKKDGTEIDCLLASNLWRDNKGEILGYKGIAHDVTELKRMEEDRQRYSDSLQRTVREAINVIALMAETRDPYTAGHQRLVTKLACAIAEEMGLPEEKTEAVRVAATLHDIGKVQIPAEILSKPGRLNEIEMSLIKSHPQVGYDIVKTVKLPWPVCPVILQHHERMDGSGYPKGLLGEDICLEARILAVADVVEAMASHRPYRPALGIEKALEEITQHRGILYDADVVEACLKLFIEKGFKLE